VTAGRPLPADLPWPTRARLLDQLRAECVAAAARDAAIHAARSDVRAMAERLLPAIPADPPAVTAVRRAVLDQDTASQERPAPWRRHARVRAAA
jgi:hypothetical protein